MQCKCISFYANFTFYVHCVHCEEHFDVDVVYFSNQKSFMNLVVEGYMYMPANLTSACFNLMHVHPTSFKFLSITFVTINILALVIFIYELLRLEKPKPLLFFDE